MSFHNSLLVSQGLLAAIVVALGELKLEVKQPHEPPTVSVLITEGDLKTLSEP